MMDGLKIRKRLHVEIVSRYDKEEEPVTTAMPMKQGELFPEQLRELHVLGGGRELPAQFRVTASWKDGSVKWLLISFLACFPANREMEFILESGTGGKQELFSGVSVQREETDGGMLVTNGCLEMELAVPGEAFLFRKLKTPWCTWEKDAVEGPVLEDLAGNCWKFQIGDEGWEILEQGPVRALLRTKGKHVRKGKTWFDGEVMLTVWAGKPWFQMDYQFINCEADRSPETRQAMELNNEQAGLKYDVNYPYEQMKSIRMFLHPEKGKKEISDEEIRHVIFTSGFNLHSARSKGSERLLSVITADTVVETANEMFPEVLFSVYAADWRNRDYGVTAGIYQAYQNFPKGLESRADTICLNFLPDIGEPLTVPQGVARTTRSYIYFHDAKLDDRMLADRLHQFEMPPVAVPVIEHFTESNVLGNYVSADCNYATERFLYRYVDSRAKGLGMLNFGDGPEWEYIKQGRSKGQLIWINNEYDMPHNFMVMLARTGDRRYFDYMKAAVEHWYDVDLCHYSEQPYHKGLLYTHSVNHVSGQPVPSHQWIEGFLDYYHMTGNPKGLEAARSIAEGLLELIRLPIYQTTATVEPREIGWAMRTFMAMYRETWEERWLDACRPIVRVYIRWAEEYGTWTTPYPDNYMDRVPFMMHVGIAGLYQFYEVCPEPEVRRIILLIVDDILEHCYMKRADMFFCKQYPAVRFQNLNGMVLESLAIAYELTGEKRYIEKGLGMFSWITVENPPPIYDFSKYKQDEYTVIYNCPAGPKRCAQTLLPLLHYYRRAVELGYVEHSYTET